MKKLHFYLYLTSLKRIMTFNDLDALTWTLFDSLTPKSLPVVEHPNYENREVVSLISG